jgi:hypothetical protein
MMIKHTLLLAAVVLWITPAIYGATRLESLADRLAMLSEDLAEEGYRGFARRSRGNRADVESLYLTQQFSAGAALFRRMVSDRRPESELRDAVAVLLDGVRAAERYSFGRRQWQDMRRVLDDLSRELNASAPSREDPAPTGRVTGRMTWRGKVDDEIHVLVQGSNATVRVISGNSMGEGSSSFTSGLPRRQATVRLNQTKGRGPIEVFQQPSPDNEYTAIVRIRDPRGGSADYEFEIVW